MQSHHAVDPVLVQPHVPDPHLLHHQLFRCVLIRLPCCCLHSSPTCSIPSWTCPLPPTTPHFPEAAPGPQTENRILLPASAFPARPHTHSVSSCVGSVGVLSHPCLSVHTGPSVPEPGSSVSGHRRKVEDGPCRSLLLLQGAPVPCVFPQLSVGALDHL